MAGFVYDLILQGGRLFDPARSLDRVGDIGIKDGKIAKIAPHLKPEDARRTMSVENLLVTAGLIDMHTHCFSYHDIEGLDPDSIGVQAGVTSVVEMGSAGPFTFEALKRYVIQPAKTRVYSFIAAQSMGGYVQGHSVPDLVAPSMIDEDAAVRVITAHPEIIRGVKVQGNAPSYARFQTTLIELVKRIARAAKVPAYLHLGQAEADPNTGVWIGGVYQKDQATALGGSVDEVLPRILVHLDEGDVLGHMFYYNGSIASENGRVLDGVKEAVARGVRLDVAHGWHFSLEMARKILEQGVLPYIISSDQHRDYQIPGRFTRSSCSMPLVMSKMLALGLTLEQVVTMSTTNPADVMKISHHSGSLQEGRTADISVLAVQDGKWTYRDSRGNTADGKRRIVPVVTVREGTVFQNNPVLLPELDSFQQYDDIHGREGAH